MQPCILITGATGFLGKVVLEELCRRRNDDGLPAHRVFLLVRNKNGEQAQERFNRLAKSLCFSRLSVEWLTAVEIVVGDLRDKQCGLKAGVYEQVCRQTTHMIHCAASVDFDLSLAEAARANIDCTLNALQLARDCPHLQRMVDTSTAYVNVAQQGPIQEALAPLPAPAKELYNAIRDNRIEEQAMLRLSGHPNTYTFTKSIAEHLVSETKGSLPVTIVRPSIISASLNYPFPGWIDSRAALGGLVALLGAGLLHVMEGDHETIHDVIPVDVVADHLINEVQLANYRSEEAAVEDFNLRIVHSVAGLENGCSLAKVISMSVDYFSRNVMVKRPYWKYTGPKNMSYHWYRTVSQQLPLRISLTYYKMTRKTSMLKRTKRVAQSLKKVNTGFPYFCSNTFDFCRSTMVDLQPDEYLGIVLRGIHKHLMLGER